MPYGRVAHYVELLKEKSSTFRRIFELLDEAPESQVNIWMVRANPARDNFLAHGGSGADPRPGGASPFKGPYMRLWFHPGSIQDEEGWENRIIHELLHAAGAFVKEVDTDVEGRCGPGYTSERRSASEGSGCACRVPHSFPRPEAGDLRAGAFGVSFSPSGGCSGIRIRVSHSAALCLRAGGSICSRLFSLEAVGVPVPASARPNLQ